MNYEEFRKEMDIYRQSVDQEALSLKDSSVAKQRVRVLGQDLRRLGGDAILTGMGIDDYNGRGSASGQ